MKKYAVMETQGNETRILEVCQTKEAALNAKRLLKQKYRGQDVQIDAIYGDFDESGKLTMNRYRLLYEL